LVIDCCFFFELIIEYRGFLKKKKNSQQHIACVSEQSLDESEQMTVNNFVSTLGQGGLGKRVVEQVRL
jgi:hypothetical protein